MAEPTKITTYKAGEAGGIDSTSLSHQRMLKLAERIDSLKGGTDVMREKGTKFLPKFPAEQQKAYEFRRDRTFLYNGYGQTLRDMIAMPFSKEVDVKERDGLPEPLGSIEKNVDRRGCTLTAYAREELEEGVDRGLCFTLVDAPPALKDGTSLRNVDRTTDRRPYFVHIRALDLLGARTQRLPNGALHVTEIRFRQCSVEPLGRFGEKAVDRIRVVRAAVVNEVGALTEPGSFELWRKEKTTDGDVWTLEDGGSTTWRKPYLPFEPAYLRKVADLEGEPVLNDLASENVKHWQNSSDQQLGVTMGRCPLIAIIGEQQQTDFERKASGANGDPIVITPMGTVRVPIGGDVKVVETTGAALEVGRQDLKDSEQRMQVLGLQALLDPGSAKFAAEVTATQGRSESGIQSMIRAIEQQLERCYQHAADWVGEQLPKGFSIDIHNEFGLGAKAVEEMRVIMEMWKGGAIDARTVLGEAKRRQFFSQTLDIDATIQAAKEDGPPLGSLSRFLSGGGNQPPPLNPGAKQAA